MELAVSQIAWLPSEEGEIASLLRSKGVRQIELAPPRIFADPSEPQLDEALKCRSFWRSFGLTPVAFQALLFGRPDLKLFSDNSVREELFSYLAKTIVAAGHIGVRALVFGSPINRQVPANLSAEAAWDISCSFFERLADVANDSGTWFCIEPNPKQYGCNFVTTADEGLRLVKDVGKKGFGLHLDLAGMWLAGDTLETVIPSSIPILRHFHVSSPNLEEVKNNGLPYSDAIRELKKNDYTGSVSIEMKSKSTANWSAVESAVDFMGAIINSQDSPS